MALIICPECNDARMSDNAAQCPKCGCGMDIIRKMMEEKRKRYQESKKTVEELIYGRAEYEWDCYVGAIAEAADTYNNKFEKIKDHYSPILSALEVEANTLMGKVEKAEVDVKNLGAEIETLGVFKNAERKELTGKISEITKAMNEEHSLLKSKIDEVKEHCNSEIDVIAEDLINEKNKQVERIESEVEDLTVRECASAEDIVKQIIGKKSFKGEQIRNMLAIRGAMTTAEIKEQLPFTNSDDSSISSVITYGIDELLADKEFCTSAGIGEKKIIDDYYFVALTDSAKDRIRQDEMRAFNQRMQDLEERRRALALQNYSSLVLSKPIETQKQASVIKRGIAGAIIAGPAGAIIGGMSAINNNMVAKAREDE